MHIYELDGKSYPSVTTIIHSLGSEELMKWSNIMGFKHRKIEDILEQSSTFGTLVHSHLRNIVDPECGETPISPKDSIEEFNLMKIKSKFIRYLSDFQFTTMMTEKTIISKELGYGGTLDWYALMRGLKMLNDFKTSKRVQVTMLFQLGGYYNLLRSIGEDPDGCSIFIINDRMCQMYPYDKESLKLFGDVFQSLAEFYTKSIQVKVSLNRELLARLTTG